MYVLVAAENTKQYPNAAVTKIGKPSQVPKITPQVAPIANNGVTSPPLKPIPVQIAVNIIFNIKS